MKALFIFFLVLTSLITYSMPVSQEEAANGHIVCQLVCQAPPVDGTTGELINLSKPIYRDSFSPREAVWVAIDVTKWRRKKCARVYVVRHTGEDCKDEMVLVDVSKEYEKINIPPKSRGVIYIPVWKRPKINPTGYDVIVDFPPFGRYNRGKDIVDGTIEDGVVKKRGFLVPEQWVCLESITFNHAPHCGYYDALDIRQNWDIDIIPPEWQRGKKSYPATYIRNRNITLKAVLSASSNIRAVTIGAVKISGDIGDIREASVSFTKNLAFKKFKLGTRILQVHLPVPDEVASFYQEWKWYFSIEKECETKQFIGNSRNKIFIILASPQSPWEMTKRSKPWASLLHIVCTCARGETTPGGAADRISNYLYNNVGGEYNRQYEQDEGGGNFTLSSFSSGFFLKDFLSKIPHIGTVNCSDMSKALVTFGNIIGCDLNYRRSEEFADKLNCIKPVGCDWCCDEEKFGYHAFTSIGDKIFDATFYYASCSDKQEEAPLSAQVMTNIPWRDYNRIMINSGHIDYPDTFRFNIITRKSKDKIENLENKNDANRKL